MLWGLEVRGLVRKVGCIVLDVIRLGDWTRQGMLERLLNIVEYGIIAYFLDFRAEQRQARVAAGLHLLVVQDLIFILA